MEDKKYLRTMSANDQTKLAVMQRDIEYIKTGMDDLKGGVSDVKDKMEIDFVTKDYLETKLQPLEQTRKIVMGFVGLLLAAFGTAVIAFFLGGRS